MAFLEDLINEVKDDITLSASGSLSGCLEEIRTESYDFFKSTASDIHRWLGMVKTGDLKESEFIFLIKGKKNLVKLLSLEKAGIKDSKIESLRNKILSITARAALTVLTKGLV